MSGIVCDTSGLLAFFDAVEDYGPVADVIDAEPGPFVVSPLVLAELDFLLATRRGAIAEMAALSKLASGAW